MIRAKIIIRGAVQGVGFRPFVYKLSDEMGVKGNVLNSSAGVFINAEADDDVIKTYIRRIEKEKPPRSFIQSFEVSYPELKFYDRFEILKSSENGIKSALILPDIAICDDCLKEIFDPDNRRYLYPFTNCTNCGPRFTIIERLPYDRVNTSMRHFPMCDECRAEYEDPMNRRFHAQPNACHKCGPQTELWDRNGNIIAVKHKAILAAAEEILKGKTATVKGLGGFHLMCDARNYEAVKILRERKHREEKPFALMYPDIETAEKDCIISEAEMRSLTSVEKPIVLLRKKDRIKIAENIAPGNPYLGIMLPYTPMHHIIMKELGIPVAATSGNLSEEPICTDERQAPEKLGGIADIFLVHNRPIVRHADDSIVRIIDEKEMLIRRARGYAPLPVKIRGSKDNILATGAHLKNTIALKSGDNVFISQHIGDLETEEAYNAFERVITDLKDMYEVKNEMTVCDMHPDYLSTKYAEGKENILHVQHHYAHVMSCIAENEIEGEVMGVSWDGTGYGTDGTIWGGEFLKVNENGFERYAHLRTFRLPGGDKAIKDIWRTSAGLLYELYGEETFNDKTLKCFHGIYKNELEIVKNMLKNGINSPITSSAGRLFDAAASLAGITNKSSYEGQAATQLEFLADGTETVKQYEFEIIKSVSSYVIDWKKIAEGIIKDVKDNISKNIIAAKFHNALVKVITEACLLSGIKKIALTGGCFQNKYLLEKTIKELKRNGLNVYRHQRVPSNDGGISLGQTAAAIKEF